MEKWTSVLPWLSGEQFNKVIAALSEKIESGEEVLPPPDSIFRAYELTDPDTVKVVILGQDPYPTPGYANGLAFSVQPEIDPLPKSLNNIFSELELDCNQRPPNGSLVGWARQGVLLMNSSLTVRPGDPGSHKDLGWSGLIDETLSYLNLNREHLVFMLWGNDAQQRGHRISRGKHLVLTSPHPSPLSAYRGFFGSRPFSKTNCYLVEHEISPIDWSAAE